MPILMSSKQICVAKYFLDYNGGGSRLAWGAEASEGGLASGGWLRVLSHHPVLCIAVSHVLYSTTLYCIVSSSVFHCIVPPCAIHCSLTEYNALYCRTPYKAFLTHCANPQYALHCILPPCVCVMLCVLPSSDCIVMYPYTSESIKECIGKYVPRRFPKGRDFAPRGQRYCSWIYWEF